MTISRLWVPVYFVYHVLLAAALDARVSTRSIAAFLKHQAPPTAAVLPAFFYTSMVASWFNFFCVAYVVHWYSDAIHDNPDERVPQSVLDLTARFVLCVLVADVWFYATHRLLHVPFLFRHIHRYHHWWLKPVAYVAYFCHPVENILVNAGTVLVPLYVVDASTLLTHLWVVAAITQSTIAHAGPLSLHVLSSKHDIHHRQFGVEFGINLFMDRLAGTSGSGSTLM